MKKPIVTRYKKNPILTKNDVPYQVATVHNAGMVKYSDKYIMLFRSHLHNGRSVIGIAEALITIAFVGLFRILMPETEKE